MLEKYSILFSLQKLKNCIRNYVRRRSFSIDEKNKKDPVIIKHDPLMRIWYKKDYEFSVAKTYIILDFISLSMYNASDMVSSRMFAELFCDSFHSYPYATEIAGLKWELFNSNCGITIAINGYDEKQGLLIEKLLDHLIHFEIDKDRFDVMKSKYMQIIEATKILSPYQQATSNLVPLLMEHLFSPTAFDRYNGKLELRCTTLRKHISRFLNSLHVECFIFGNMTKQEALNIATLLEKKIHNITPPIVPSRAEDLPFSREICLNREDANVKYYLVNEVHDTACALILYQHGRSRTNDSNVCLELLVHLMSEPCQDVLKYEKNLGDVSIGVFTINATQGLRFIVQNTEKKTLHIEKEIDIFVDSISTRISRIPISHFNKCKETLIALRQKRTFNTTGTMIWDEILMQQYKFNRANEEINVLNKLTKETFLDYCKKLLHIKARHKISVYIIGLEEKDQMAKTAKNLMKIEDVRREHSSFPLLRSRKYPPKGKTSQSHSYYGVSTPTSANSSASDSSELYTDDVMSMSDSVSSESE